LSKVAPHLLQFNQKIIRNGFNCLNILDNLLLLCYASYKYKHLGGNMGFKKIESKIGFAELALSSSMAKNRSLKTLEQMNKVIDWSKIESNLMKHYKIGISNEGADAYPPLMLFKCLETFE